jgi:hypothetical protein
MNKRLEFINSLNNYIKESDKDEAILVITHNMKTHDLVLAFNGEWETISLIMSNHNAVNHSETSIDTYNNIKKLILNTAVNICKEDNKTLNIMLDGLKNIKQ